MISYTPWVTFPEDAWVRVRWLNGLTFRLGHVAESFQINIDSLSLGRTVGRVLHSIRLRFYALQLGSQHLCYCRLGVRQVVLFGAIASPGKQFFPVLAARNQMPLGGNN